MTDLVKNKWRGDPKSDDKMVAGDQEYANIKIEKVNLTTETWNEKKAAVLEQFAVKVNGLVVSQPFPTQMLAEQHRQSLIEEQKSIAEIVKVDPQGRELLLG